MTFSIPPRAEVGYLDAEIAGEGAKVILSDGVPVSNNAPASAALIPDWTKIKSIRHYFFRTGYTPYPAWLYHPTEKPIIVQGHEEAAKYGVVYRKTTAAERQRFGAEDVWDWDEDSPWRPVPQGVALQFDPRNPGHGKTYVAPTQTPAEANMALANAIAQAFSGKGPAAPAEFDPKMLEEFRAFMEFRKREAAEFAPATELAPEDDLDFWRGNAEEAGVKVDRRWGVERIKRAIEEAQAS